MRICCPNCQRTVEIVPGREEKPSPCPHCGTRLTILDETLAYQPGTPKVLGKFQLLEHVGSGHFGDVWKARDLELQRIVAVKIPRTTDFDSSASVRLVREARAAARLRHPNIVTVHEVGTAQETIYIVSDFVHGVTLADLILQKRPTQRKAVELCIKVAGALEHAHQAGVIHRDLKPANILVDAAGEPYVTDFGLAKREGGEITMTVEGQVLGTPAYMPPEQASGDAYSADPRSDVYSLGVTLYELLTGQRPFCGGTRMLLHQILSDDPPPLRKLDKSIPRDLETICLKALAKERSRRYQTAREMADDLQRFLDGKPIRARPIGRLARFWRWARRNPALAAMGGAAIGLAVLLAVALWRPREREVLLQTVTLGTEPPGADVVFIPLAPSDGTPLPERKKEAQRKMGASGTGALEVELPPGDYLVVAYLDDGRFHEVLRHVPAAGESRADHGYFAHRRWTLREGRVELTPIRLPPASITNGMALVPPSDEFVMGSSELRVMAPPHRRVVPPFYLDTTEVTYSQLQERGITLEWLVGVKCQELLKQEEKQGDFPITCVSWDEAVALAEFLGKRLPDEAEYEYAATKGGIRKFPWGDSDEGLHPWTFEAAGSPSRDRVAFDGGIAIFGLYSNVAEWTASWCAPYPGQPDQHMPECRVYRGGGHGVINRTPEPGDWGDSPRIRVGLTRSTWLPGLGFRCARSVKPRLAPEDFVRIVPDPAPPQVP